MRILMISPRVDGILLAIITLFFSPTLIVRGVQSASLLLCLVSLSCLWCRSYAAQEITVESKEASEGFNETGTKITKMECKNPLTQERIWKKTLKMCVRRRKMQCRNPPTRERIWKKAAQNDRHMPIHPMKQSNETRDDFEKTAQNERRFDRDIQ